MNVIFFALDGCIISILLFVFRLLCSLRSWSILCVLCKSSILQRLLWGVGSST